MIEVAAALAGHWFIGGSAVGIIIAVIVTTINEKRKHD
jgi:hypothetical protein